MTPSRVYPESLADLPLTFPVQSPEVIAFFNRVARPTDIASFPTAVLHLLPQVTAGQRMASFPSWADAEARLDALAPQLDWILYNPEHWENTPTSEQTNLVATVARAQTLAHDHGLRLMLAPDRRFVDAALPDLAPHTDALLLQGQRLQADPAAFAAWITAMTEVARAANPDLLVYVQVGATLGSAHEMAAALETVAPFIDGVAVWSMPRTLPTLQEFVERAKQPLPVTPSGSTPGVTPPATSPPGTPTVTRPMTPTTSSTPSSCAPGTATVTQPPPSPAPANAAVSRTPEAAGRASPGSRLAGIGLAIGGLGVAALLGHWALRRKVL